jgi:hypothetical protein
MNYVEIDCHKQHSVVTAVDGVEFVTLAHSLKVRAIAEAKIKTDTIDSHTLAQFLRVDLIPAAYIPNKETRSFKEMIRSAFSSYRCGPG